MGKTATLAATTSLSLPPDSYVYKILPTDAHLAAISSDNSLRIIDPYTLQEISNGNLQNVQDGVTCLEAADSDNHSLLTAGRDGFVRRWDLRSGKQNLEFWDGR